MQGVHSLTMKILLSINKKTTWPHLAFTVWRPFVQHKWSVLHVVLLLHGPSFQNLSLPPRFCNSWAGYTDEIIWYYTPSPILGYLCCYFYYRLHSETYHTRAYTSTLCTLQSPQSTWPFHCSYLTIPCCDIPFWRLSFWLHLHWQNLSCASNQY